MTYKSKRTPWEHQKKGLKKCEGAEAFAFLMAMRTGKSKLTLDDFGRLEDGKEVKDFFLVAPAGVYHTWTTAMAEHMSDDLFERTIPFVWKSGMGVGERRRFEQFLKTQDPSRPRAFLMNVEALSRPGDARKAALAFLSQREIYGGIDESTIIKNPKAECTKFINRELSELINFRRILSGLPTPRSPLDLYSQFEYLDKDILGHDSFFTFQHRYAVMKPLKIMVRGRERWVQVVDGYQNVEELQALIEPHSFRVEFRPDIPSTYSKWEVEMTEAQREAYSEMKQFAAAKIGANGYVTSKIVIDQLLKLHQILCGHLTDDEGIFREIKENRTRDLLTILEEYNGKAVIWCSYDADVRKVAAALEKEYGEGSVARFWGGNTKTREAEEKHFQNDDACRFQVATPGAGGKGRMWAMADLVIYYSSTNNLEHREQSEQRVQGVEKKRQVDYIDMIVPNTIEDKILEALRAKIDMATVINGDNYREWLI